MTWNLVNQELKPAFEILRAGWFKIFKMNNGKTDIAIISSSYIYRTKPLINALNISNERAECS